MKIFKKVLALTIASVMALSVVACGAATEETQPSGADTIGGSTVDLSTYTFETVYGTQLNGYLNRQYYFDGEPISLAESNFYYVDSFITLNDSIMYGWPMTGEGFIDLSASFPNNDGTVAYANIGEFLIDYAERTMESTLIVSRMAKDAGITLSEEDLAEVDATIANLEANTAAPAGVTLEEYLHIFYGPTCTVEDFRQIICNYKLTDLYTENFIETYDFDEVPYVRYVLFSAPEGSDEATAADAEAKANELLASSTDLDQLELHGALAYTNGEAVQSSIVGVDKGYYVADFENWAYDESRKEGDMEVIYAPEFGYFVVGYAGTTEASFQSKSNQAIAIIGDQVTEMIDNGEHTFITNDPFTPAEPIPVITDPVTGQIITPTSAPQGLAGQSMPVRVLEVVGGVLLLGGIAFGISAYSKKKADGEDVDPDDDGSTADEDNGDTNVADTNVEADAPVSEADSSEE